MQRFDSVLPVPVLDFVLESLRYNLEAMPKSHIVLITEKEELNEVIGIGGKRINEAGCLFDSCTKVDGIHMFLIYNSKAATFYIIPPDCSTMGVINTFYATKDCLSKD